ncbi:hypothetical protein [Variovorax sp. 278MFTsu5.1]|jgi:hypothetical protein|uniref:hypothetical protein n=1 Tax=Variovorax sp. 278MFTsu5.1 TaxID=3158366 RepID=UPI003AADFA8B
MNHYVNAGVVKSLAYQLVASRVAAGLLKIKNRRQFRDAVIATVHSAFLGSVA